MLVTPADNDPNDIAASYICDQYIDCDNMSDEYSCSASLPIAFICYGIITSVLIVLAFFTGVLVVVFGWVRVMKRIKAASPVFLLSIVLACIVGYGSTFTFYGKPDTTACVFRMWLLAPAITLMVSSLCVKSLRIWLIFRSNKPTAWIIPDWWLVVLVVVLELPVAIILILWSALATPYAQVLNISGKDHWICRSGSVGGYALGIVFFALLVAYIGLILLFGVFLAIVTRKLPSRFNESQLIGMSVYNLTFLSAVVIPLYFVLETISPLARWIVVVSGILYGFAATMFLQFAPRFWGVARDKCNPKLEQKRDREKSTSEFSGSSSNTISLQSI